MYFREYNATNSVFNGANMHQTAENLDMNCTVFHSIQPTNEYLCIESHVVPIPRTFMLNWGTRYTKLLFWAVYTHLQAPMFIFKYRNENPTIITSKSANIVMSAGIYSGYQRPNISVLFDFSFNFKCLRRVQSTWRHCKSTSDYSMRPSTHKLTLYFLELR